MKYSIAYIRNVFSLEFAEIKEKELWTITNCLNNIHVKVSPLQAIEAHGDVNARIHTYTATALGRGKILRSAAFIPGEIPSHSFYRRLSEHQDQSGHEGVK